jgi:hypothetical protein
MYSFGEGTVSRITQMFHIDSETGIIRTLQLLKDSGKFSAILLNPF